MVYCTYVQYGVLKRGVLSETQYTKYQQDPSIVNLQPYATQRSMDEAYAKEKGGTIDKRSILHG